jgi:hypothetical protein
MMRKVALALVVGTAFSPLLFAPGCGGSSSTTDAGRDAKDGGNDGRAGTGGGGAGGGAGGTTGASGMDGGAAGMDAAAGTGGIDAPVDMATDMTTQPDTAQPDLRPDGAMATSWMFDTTTQGWVFSPYGSTPNGMPNAADNLAKTSTLAWDPANDADNKTTSGSLKGTVPFKMQGDRIDFQAFSQPTAKYDWMGYQVSAKVKLVSGGNLAANCPLYAYLYVSQAPDYSTRTSAQVPLQTGAWVTLTFDLADATINTKAISQLGIQIDTGPACGGGGGTGDGGVDGGDDAGDGSTDLLVDALGDAVVVVPPTASTAVILIDNVIVSVK